MNPLTNDLVVVLPGIMGSTLARHGRPVWTPSAGAVLRAVGSFARSVTALRLPDGIGDAHPGDGVAPVALMPDLHAIPGIWTPVKGYDRLRERLRRLGYREPTTDPEAPPPNLLPVAYDWRLSCRYNAHRLKGIVEPALARWRGQGGAFADARIVFVCHSMGGLVARWYIERCGGAALTHKLILIGTPYRGALKALRQLVNGMPPILGPLAPRFHAFATSLPSLHQLLPEYACVESGGALRTLSELPPPHLDSTMVADAMAFHACLRKADADRPAGAASTHAIVGVRQPTPTTARITADRLVALDTYLGDDHAGDATVPVAGATPAGVPLDTNTVRRIADKHGNLQRNKAVLDEVEFVLTSRSITPRAGTVVQPRVDVPELILAGQPLPVDVALPDGEGHGIQIAVFHERDERRPIAVRTPRPTGGRFRATFTDLPPGGYTVAVSGLHPADPVTPVSSEVLVWTTQVGLDT